MIVNHLKNADLDEAAKVFDSSTYPSAKLADDWNQIIGSYGNVTRVGVIFICQTIMNDVLYDVAVVRVNTIQNQTLDLQIRFPYDSLQASRTVLARDLSFSLADARTFFDQEQELRPQLSEFIATGSIVDIDRPLRFIDDSAVMKARQELERHIETVRRARNFDVGNVVQLAQKQGTLLAVYRYIGSTDNVSGFINLELEPRLEPPSRAFPIKSLLIIPETGIFQLEKRGVILQRVKESTREVEKQIIDSIARLQPIILPAKGPRSNNRFINSLRGIAASEGRYYDAEEFFKIVELGKKAYIDKYEGADLNGLRSYVYGAYPRTERITTFRSLNYRNLIVEETAVAAFRKAISQLSASITAIDDIALTYDVFSNQSNALVRIDLKYVAPGTAKTTVRSTYTNGKIENLFRGAYVLTASKAGYKTASIDEFNTVHTAGTIITCTLYREGETEPSKCEVTVAKK
jgi:hypothetical protein